MKRIRDATMSKFQQRVFGIVSVLALLSVIVAGVLSLCYVSNL